MGGKILFNSAFPSARTHLLKFVPLIKQKKTIFRLDLGFAGKMALNLGCNVLDLGFT